MVHFIIVKWKECFLSFGDLFTKIGRHLFCLCVCQLFHLFIDKWKIGYFAKCFNLTLTKFWEIFPWAYLTDQLQSNFYTFLSVCLSFSSFVHWKTKKLDLLLSFQDILTNFCWHHLLKLSHRWVWTKFQKFVCESVSWFFCWHFEKF